jgi:hypothetical protein
MREQQYYDSLIADNAVSQAEERRMLLAFVASIGAERSLCEYARTYVAEGKHAPLSRNWNLSAQERSTDQPRPMDYYGGQYDQQHDDRARQRGGERTYSAGGQWSYPDSFPPNFQDR